MWRGIRTRAQLTRMFVVWSQQHGCRVYNISRQYGIENNVVNSIKRRASAPSTLGPPPSILQYYSIVLQYNSTSSAVLHYSSSSTVLALQYQVPGRYYVTFQYIPTPQLCHCATLQSTLHSHILPLAFFVIVYSRPPINTW